MHARSAIRPSLAIALAVLCACGPAQEAGPDAGPGPGAAPDDPETVLQRDGAASVIVALDLEGGEAAAAVAGPGTATARAAARGAAYEAAKASLLSAVSTADLEVVHRYAALPVLHLRVRSRAALAALRARPEVASVHPDVANEASLAESLPLVGQPAAQAAGATGAGTAVAILDTGLDYTRAAFGSCSAPGTPGCRVKYVADFAPGDGALDANGHGTNVAGIVAGVAPGADLIGLDVFNGQYAYTSDILNAINWCVTNQAAYNIVAINMSLGAGAYTGPCTDGFTAGIHAAHAAGIAVVVASGNNGYSDKISSPACAAEAVSVGAVYDAPLGAIGFSVCSDATTAADKVACFSNSSPYLTLLAPGAMITAAGITMAGTSQATPHVAGAIAVVRGANPSLSPDDAVTQLRATGKPITDPRNGVTTPRIDLSGVSVGGCPAFVSAPGTLSGEGGGAAASLSLPPACAWTATSGASWLTVSPASGSGSAGLTVTAAPNPGAARTATLTVAGKAVTVTQAADTTAPTGAAALVGAPAVVGSLAVTLSLSASDPNGVPSVCVSNAATCTTWRALAATIPWTLAAGASGDRIVYVRFKDGAGNVTATPLQVRVRYDATPPTGGALTAAGGAGQVALSWTGFADAGSGVASYLVVAATAAVPAAGCGGTRLYAGPGTVFTHAGLADGTVYHYRVCAVDGVGNVSAGVTADGRPAPEYTPPGSASVAVTDGPYVKTLTVHLALAAVDPAGVPAMCISNATTCTAWEPFAATRTWTLAAGAGGVRTIRAWFRDGYGNVSVTPATATVTYDVAAPAGGVVTTTGGDGQVALSWSGFTDAGAGLAGYLVVAGTAAVPAAGCAGAPLYAGTGTSFVHTGLSNGTVYHYRVCAIDRAGNVAAGITRDVRPAPEYTPPSGTVAIREGAVVRALAVTLDLAATDPSGVAAMCVSNLTTCTAWEPYAASKAWTLAVAGSGVRTVRVWFRDLWGNASAAPAMATTAYDVTAPTGGALTATPLAGGQVALAWSGFADALSGVGSYRLVGALGAAPASCAGTPLYQGPLTTVRETGLTPGAVWGFRVCAVDRAGNVSAGVAKTVTVAAATAGASR